MSTSRRLRFSVGLVVMALVAAGLSFVAQPPAPVSAAWVCNTGAETDTYDQSAARGRVPEPDAGGNTYPIVTIHGITGTDADFSGVVDLSLNGGAPQPPRSLVDVMAGVEGVTAYQGLPQAHVYSFSYTPDSLRWVDHERVGGRFAAVVDCLYERHGTPVSVVAHSMGGLVTRWVANTVDAAGVPRADKLGQVITMGTPFLGSDLAAVAGGVSDATTRSSVWWRLITLLCGQLGTETGVGSCGPIPLLSAGSSEAGRALRTGSSELAALKPWPSGLSVHALATSTTLEARLFNASLGIVDLGDIVVGTRSAIDGASSHRTFRCAYDIEGTPPWRLLADTLGISEPSTRRTAVANLLLSQPCYHSHLMRNVGIVNEALGQLANWIGDQAATGPAATSPSAPVLRPDGIGSATFGDDAEQAVEYLVSVLGPPTDDTGWQDTGYDPNSPDDQCQSPFIRYLIWPFMSLTFAEYDPARARISERRTFVSYSYYEYEPGQDTVNLQTDRGLRLGSSIADVVAAHPKANVEGSSAYERDVFDGMFDQDGNLNRIFAGIELCQA